MSLPHYLRTRADCVPAGVPYLKVQDDRLARARTLVSPAEGAISVGIVWQGRPSQHHNTRRSVPVSLFSPLMDIDGVNWCSLQTGEAVHLLPEGRSGRRCHDLGSGFTDFADTAAVMAHLDVVIAVDTAVAHLAGALGKELWLLLSSPADWRWMHGRNDSLWYPTCRVFRQPRPGDWESVIRTVQQKLSRLTERRRIPEKREQ